ncbi:hypothetical protein [Microbulbifer sp. YPW16]|uniref:hypothetical protein n=1 Tax=Microbulbifer sp. YPW16 TaxID=2904242 RepID=UPI001E54A928|nr:hypothetical protein [Microbulbifer sp. YPW16]UHQ54775.1 hypothetical protein LVE68_14890 [Microbulbifer sp. YPW16]
MTHYSSPCYTLAEAQEMLSLRGSELAHAIRSKEIQAVVYTGHRQILLFVPKETDHWIGCAVIRYRGHMSLHVDTIASLLDGQIIHVGQGWGYVWEDFGVSDWRHQYPFERELPHGPIREWRPVEKDKFPLHKFYATPLPKEATPWTDTLADMLDKMASPEPVPKEFEDFRKSLPGKEGPILDFKSNSRFEPESLRIPASEIERFRDRQSQARFEVRRTAAVGDVKAQTRGLRSSQLHELIERIVRADPHIKAKAIWRLIEQDADLDEPVFDTDHILVRVDSDCIEWCNRSGKSLSLTWNSFGPTLAKIRSRLAAECPE